MSVRFYEDLPAFTDFAEVTGSGHFVPVPDGWTVVLTDVRGSTEAIAQGRYRDVNRIGAATIVCAQDVLGDLVFPYVFGGDGATMLVPTDRADAVCRHLAGLKALARTRYDLALRVARVPVEAIRTRGATIEVGKLGLAAGRGIALFRGGGLTIAEALVKGDEARYGLDADPDVAVDLDPLSCRWNPIPSRQGTVLALLVVGRDDAVYGEVLAALGDLDAANPVNRDAMTYKPAWMLLREEVRQIGSVWSRALLGKLTELFFAVISLGLGLPGFGWDAKGYAASIPSHSDYRKFDDALRLIVDCTPEQAAHVEALLARLHDEGRVYYGVHAASTCLLTCYVHTTRPGDHVHFVDGGDGGYAMAALQLKEQMRQATSGS